MSAYNHKNCVKSEYAVVVSNVYKHFVIRGCDFSGKSVINALNGINITVKSNTIYGLLGPSGTGKTTLLKAILGQVHIDKGHIEVMGQTPGHATSIPGPGAGYMPQEMALFKEFTINETLFYFGRIFRMSGSQIKRRREFLTDLLDLPKKDRIIRSLSGGQQRRVSFAVALLHDPPLLILDEPTVGVDPLLRQKIWAHLVSLTQSNSSTTVIITTHYIEEARRADKVGFMRQGEILAEDEPEKLIAIYSLPTLEDVFLKLCSNNDLKPNCAVDSQDQDHLFSIGNNGESFQMIEHNKMKQHSVKIKDSCCSSSKNFSPSTYFSIWRFLACFIKGFIVLQRNPGYLLFQFFLPFIQTFLFCYCIGTPPYNLNIGFVNQDKGSYGSQYLNFINNNTINLIDYGNSTEDAFRDVTNLKLWAYLHIRENFTKALDKKLQPFSKIDNITLESSSIYVHADNTDLQIGLEINKTLVVALRDFMLPVIKGKLSLIKDVDKKLVLPLNFYEPVFGKDEPSFTDFMVPGILHTIIYFLATGMTAMTIITERKEGLLGRSVISGVTFFEILTANSTLQFFILLVQVVVLLLCALLLFKVENLGSTVLLGCILLLSGYSGMCYGYFISSICDTEIAAVQLAIGSMYPSIILNGVIWPLEGMPPWLQSIVKCLPLSYAIIAMRSIMLRGFGLMNSYVLMGFGVLSVWSVGFFALCLIVLSIRRNFFGLST